MRTKRYLAFALAWFSLTLCLGASLAWAEDHAAAKATDPLGNINRLPADLERKVGQLRTNLEGNGFTVARGYWTLWGIEDCKYPLQTLGYCYGNNPTAPYVVAVVPQWKDEYADPRFHHIVNEPLRNMSATYRLDTHEALIVVAQLPPEARYFGIGSNVFTREAEFDPKDTKDPIYPQVTDPLLRGILFGVSPDPSRRMMVASIGNSTNNVIIGEQTGEGPWNRPAYIIITSDAELEKEMTDALKGLGVHEHDIFTEPVSPDLVNLGLGRSADDLITYIRYAMPLDQAAGEQWRRDLPLTILRVRDMRSKTYNHSLPVPTYGSRTANYDETKLAADLTTLQNAVIASWGPKVTATILPFFSAYKFLDLIGQHCLGYPDAERGPMDCLGDSPDADYQISGSAQIDNGEVVAVVGVLSTKTENATYTSLSVNWFPELVGVANIDDTTLEGTASSIPGAPSNSDLFYVYYVARDCSGLTHCVAVSKKLVPTGGIIKFIQRNYINPGSSSGPNPDYILNPVTIVLDGGKRPTVQ
ncbi:MAG: hypothetical protein ACLGRW_04365 [Acidobacteriota bacterium]